jgi:hypothetical protein
VQIVTDETQQWFAGGTFEFSRDCRLLIHKTRWRSTVRINLQDGSVSRNWELETKSSTESATRSKTEFFRNLLEGLPSLGR